MKTYVLSKLTMSDDHEQESTIFVGKKYEILHYICHQNPSILAILQGVEEMSQDEWFNELKIQFSEQADSDYSSTTRLIGNATNTIRIDIESDKLQIVNYVDGVTTVYNITPEQTN